MTWPTKDRHRLNIPTRIPYLPAIRQVAVISLLPRDVVIDVERGRKVRLLASRINSEGFPMADALTSHLAGLFFGTAHCFPVLPNANGDLQVPERLAEMA